MKIERECIRKVCPETLKEAEKILDLIQKDETIMLSFYENVVDAHITFIKEEMEEVLKNTGFDNPSVSYNLDAGQGSGASFIADSFETIENVDFDALRKEHPCMVSFIDEIEGIYKTASGEDVYATSHCNEYRTHYVHSNTVEWDIDDTVDEKVASEVEMCLWNVEKELENIMQKEYYKIAYSDELLMRYVVEEELCVEADNDTINKIKGDK